MIKTITYAVRTPWLKDPVNATLIVLPTGKAILIDTGADSPETWEAFENAVWGAGIGWESIEYILLTHGHPDHFGLAARILERTGATVLMHPADVAKVVAGQHDDPGWWETAAAILVRHGLTNQTYNFGPATTLDKSYALPVPAGSIRPLPSRLDLPGLSLDVLYTPGHTLGSCCFYSSTEKLLFTGDTVLPDITPNPVIELEAGEQQLCESLIQMRDSLLRLRQLPKTMIVPGHGARRTMTPATLIDKQLAHIAERNALVLAAMADSPLNAHELAERLFPQVEGPHKLLAISEVLGHLGWLERRKLVRRIDEAGVVKWMEVGSGTKMS